MKEPKCLYCGSVLKIVSIPGLYDVARCDNCSNTPEWRADMVPQPQESPALMHDATKRVLDQFTWNTDAFSEYTDVLCESTNEAFQTVAQAIVTYVDGPDATALLWDLLSVRNNVIMRMAQDI